MTCVCMTACRHLLKHLAPHMKTFNSFFSQSRSKTKASSYSENSKNVLLRGLGRSPSSEGSSSIGTPQLSKESYSEIHDIELGANPAEFRIHR